MVADKRLITYEYEWPLETAANDEEYIYIHRNILAM